ncbi:DUF4149 domain-containing protein [Rhodoferax saidenbachensis]|uniref:TMEM205-like domain-containing protein n=1 Tax=Rhodoferax saidenbachensis TaxID=1484693 RepID=A0A1P8K8M5_9BURK|nr:DUF4149 domain-containing protein [Rhodoferax saidenbachensis]APW42351.1 hypothetical protein RS694_07225 [Rhodoferax saidenbachensis]
MRTLPLWLAAAWAGSLTTLGFLVVPMLFVHLPTPAIAGGMAAKLFSLQTGVSTACALGLLLVFRSNRPLAPVDTARAATLFVVAGALLALLVEFGVSPHIVARDNLALWHRVGSAMYVLQWVCALVVFGKLAAARSATST